MEHYGETRCPVVSHSHLSNIVEQCFGHMSSNVLDTTYSSDCTLRTTSLGFIGLFIILSRMIVSAELAVLFIVGFSRAYSLI